ncbi:MAG TPA: beta-propeller domain-containing protein [Burkholderiales bacterium]|nr:beta-propeller domain-containing protein [Burkholderiales bacterium]
MHATPFLRRVTVVLITAAVLAGCAAEPSVAAPRKTLTAFANDQEITALFKRWAEEQSRRRSIGSRDSSGASSQGMGSMAMMEAAPAAKMAAQPAGAADSITNVQHAGVDEGGIVKRHGDHLVILRRGRLFTINMHDRELRPVSTVNAYAPDVDPSGTWYDEMLVSGNTIVVIGYSYARGGTEAGLFDITSSGRLTYKATYHLRSNDYYSSRNYASRLVGSKLVFYTPLHLNPWGGAPWSSFPAMRKWQPGVTAADFKRIAPATRIYRADDNLDPTQGVALHSVTICDVARPELDCESTAVLGAPGRVFYVSGSSVFVWTTAMRRADASASASGSAAFRIPLDGSAPTALKVAGSPIDQFSFLEGGDGYLNVLVRANGRGDAMWAAERNAGDYALLRVELDRFADGKDSAPVENYKALPRPSGYAIQNRFVGDYLLYGSGAGWNRAQRTLHSQVYAVRYADRSAAQEVPLAHGVDRIEALGTNAVVVGSDGRDLHFTSLKLAETAVPQDRYTRQNAAQGETRSHGFFYKPENDNGGLVGLPIVGGGRAGSRQLRENSAAVLFLRNQSLRLSELGALDSKAEPGASDGCRASCVDWYGNARPLFVGNRVFALMGYEIVEGRVAGNGISEVQRISFAPSPLRIGG